LRAGIAALAACRLAGARRSRLDPVLQTPRRTLERELLRCGRRSTASWPALAAPEYGGIFDLSRIAIGGMSAGGMVALRRLCDQSTPCPRAAVVECTTGWLGGLYLPTGDLPVQQEADFSSTTRPKWHNEPMRQAIRNCFNLFVQLRIASLTFINGKTSMLMTRSNV
jgi:hypothetical protein